MKETTRLPSPADRLLCTRTFDVAMQREAMKDTVARLFARVAEVEDGDVRTQRKKKINVTKKEKEKISGKQGEDLTSRIYELTMKLHARHHFTDGAACDGSKVDHATQPFTRDEVSGNTAYGIWEGIRYDEEEPETQGLLQRRLRRMREQKHPEAAEIIEAATRGTMGGRIGDCATVMDAELFAIYAFLQRVEDRATNPKDRTVLIMSDCLNALRGIEDTWRGRGHPYRKRTGGACMEAINTIRQRLKRVVFVWIPAHTGITPNVYADAIAKAHTENSTK